MKLSLPVITYHGVTDQKAAYAGADYYRVTLSTFIRHMRLIESEGFHPITFKHIKSGAPLPENPMVITFDDGEENNYSEALPVLRRFRMPGVFFIISGNIDQIGWMKEHQIKELAQAGMEIGSHSVSHRFLSNLPETDLRDELSNSKKSLEHASGEEVLSLALPGGRGSQMVRLHGYENGYEFLATSEPGINQDGFDPFKIQRWTMTESLSDRKLRSILTGNPGVITASRRKYRVGTRLKAIFGDELYHKIWTLAASVKLGATA